jgi:hypothetical protein
MKICWCPWTISHNEHGLSLPESIVITIRELVLVTGRCYSALCRLMQPLIDTTCHYLSQIASCFLSFVLRCLMHPLIDSSLSLFVASCAASPIVTDYIVSPSLSTRCNLDVVVCCWLPHVVWCPTSLHMRHTLVYSYSLQLHSKRMSTVSSNINFFKNSMHLHSISHFTCVYKVDVFASWALFKMHILQNHVFCNLVGIKLT